jgi:hypothetical protein
MGSQSIVLALKAELQKVTERVGGHDESIDVIIESINQIRETLDDLQSVLECLPNAAPVFLRWAFDSEEGCRRAKARYSNWWVEVIDGSSAVSWQVTDRRGYVVDAGGACAHFEMGLDEAAQALRHVVQSGVKASTGLKPGTEWPDRPKEHD